MASAGTHPPPPTQHRWEVPLTALACALACLVIYAQTLQFGFVYDDGYRIERLPAMAASPLKTLLAPRGLTYLFHLLDYQLWGANAAGYHATNLILHWLASLCAAFTAHRLHPKPLFGFWCGLLFACHPVHVEVVASFVNRKDALTFIFCALAVACLTASRNPRLRLLYLPLLALALASKEAAAVGLILLAPLLEPLKLTAPLTHRQRFPLLLPPLAALLTLPFLLPKITQLFQPQIIYQLTASHIDSAKAAVSACINGLPLQLELLLWPHRLSAEYTVPNTQPGPGLFLNLLGLLALCALIWFSRRRAPLVAFALLWTLVMWLPLSNLIPITPYFTADRYLYTPSFGVCLLFAWVLTLAASRLRMRMPVYFAAGLVILPAGVTAHQRARDWHDDRTLWHAALADGWDTHHARVILGTLAYNDGDHQTAVTHLEAALNQVPEDIEARIKLMIAYDRSQNHAEAVDQARLVLNAYPNQAEAHRILAMDALINSDFVKAAQHFRVFLRTNPHRDDALNNLAWILATDPNADPALIREAVALSQRACELTQNSNPAYLYTHAMALARAGRFDTALQQLELARQQTAPTARLRQQLDAAFRLFKNGTPLPTR